MRNFILIFLAAFFLSSCETTGTNPRSAKAVDIAIVMPITGNYGEMGKRASSMIEMGLEDGLKGTMKVVTYDISEDYKMDVAASRIRAQGAKIVLGPIFSPHTIEMSKRLEGSDISMITLSNNPAIASDNLYVFGHSPMRQTRRILNHMLDEDYKNFIMLLPVGRYYSELSTASSKIITAKGARLFRTEFYVGKESSINVAVENIAKIVQSINELEENDKKPVLYISDESANLQKIMRALKRHNLDLTSVIIGDNKIDIEYEDHTSYLFTGSLKYNPDELLRRLQIKMPDVGYLNYMDLMAYDLGRIVSHNIGRGLTNQQFIDRLNMGHLYLGVSGDIKFVDHVAYRKYDIIRKAGPNYEIVSRAG